MLTCLFDRRAADCSGTTRRDFLRVGTLGMAGLSLPMLLQARAASAAAPAAPGYVRDKSVVLLFLSGGASHIETFDPKLDLPGAQGSLTGDVATTIPGVRFGGTFPELAARAERLAIVRSFTHGVADHVQAIRHVLSGGTVSGGAKAAEPSGFALGAAAARLRGANHPTNGFPTHGLITADEVDPQYASERGRVRNASLPGTLGPSYGPFEPSGQSDIVKNLKLNLASGRFDARRELSRELDGLRRKLDDDAFAGTDESTRQAYELVLGGAGRALDVLSESAAVRARYDTSGIKVGHKKKSPSSLGDQLLLARRMCEVGAGFVTVHSAGWDMHADGNNPGIVAGMEMLGRTLDRAVSAFLDDVKERGLSDKILLVITGDFGRTPKVNARGGRDHWAALGPLAFAGGGLRMGQVVGRSDRQAAQPADDPVTPAMLAATILHTLFDVPRLRLEVGIARDLIKLTQETDPIKALF